MLDSIDNLTFIKLRIFGEKRYFFNSQGHNLYKLQSLDKSLEKVKIVSFQQ